MLLSLYDRITVGPLYRRFPYPQIQLWMENRENKIMESSQKPNLNLPLSGNCYMVFTLH